MAKIIPIGGTTCPECEGTGEVWVSFFGEFDMSLIDCPTCSGKGWVKEEVEWNSDERFD